MSRFIAEKYFSRFGFCARQIVDPPTPNLGITLVVPCFNEPGFIESLESIRQSDRPDCAVEVIVVVNSPEDADESIREQNRKTLDQAHHWIAGHHDGRFAVHVLHFPSLPRRLAGVGLARKIGMDEALHRFSDVNNPGGVIVGFDADCLCHGNYLTELERFFGTHPDCPAAGVYFEHPLDGPLDRRVYEAITSYELHLRYYVQALRFARFPYAHHTIGSCMCVRAEVYAGQGGMNKRRAGEDFYFLQKVIPLGGFGNITDTRVLPSPRPSNRVPFGTGKAVSTCLAGGQLTTFPLRAFADLKEFFEEMVDLPSDRATPARFPESVREFLSAHDFAGTLDEIRRNVSSPGAFRKRFFRWFNGFMAMKFLRHARDHHYGVAPIADEARKLLPLLTPGRAAPSHAGETDLLWVYRAIDREPPPRFLDKAWRGSE